VVFHGLDHNDRIVHDQADGEDKAEEGERVDRKAKEGKNRKGPHQRDRYRQERNKGRPPPLEEDEDHKNNEEEGFEEGRLHLLHSFGNSQGGVQRYLIVQIRRETLLQLLHQLLGTAGGIQGVAPRHLVERD